LEVRKETSGGRKKVNKPPQSDHFDLLMTITCREMQMFLVGFALIELCEIFTVGGFPLDNKVRIVCPGFTIQ
jgi:hypothetical protein